MSLIQLLNMNMPAGHNYWQTLIYEYDYHFRSGNSVALQQRLLGLLTGEQRHIKPQTIRKRFRMEFAG